MAVQGSEFGGEGGMLPDGMRDAPTLEQQTWGIYATNEGGVPVGTEELDYGYDHIGDFKPWRAAG